MHRVRSRPDCVQSREKVQDQGRKKLKCSVVWWKPISIWQAMERLDRGKLVLIVSWKSLALLASELNVQVAWPNTIYFSTSICGCYKFCNRLNLDSQQFVLQSCSCDWYLSGIFGLVRTCTIDETDDRKINWSIDDNRCQLIDWYR